MTESKCCITGNTILEHFYSTLQQLYWTTSHLGINNVSEWTGSPNFLHFGKSCHPGAGIYWKTLEGSYLGVKAHVMAGCFLGFCGFSLFFAFSCFDHFDSRLELYCNCIVTRGEVYNEISAEPEGFPEGSGDISSYTLIVFHILPEKKLRETFHSKQ